MKEKIVVAVFDKYVIRIMLAESKDDLDLVMTSASQDDSISPSDYVRLCCFGAVALSKLPVSSDES